MSEQIDDLLHVLKGHLSCVVGCKFSPDGGLILTASADTRRQCYKTFNVRNLRLLVIS
jgi:WD40 repeat protein